MIAGVREVMKIYFMVTYIKGDNFLMSYDLWLFAFNFFIKNLKINKNGKFDAYS